MKYWLLLVLPMLLAAACSSQAAYTLIGRIGSYDKTYADLAIAGNSSQYPSAFPNDAAFTLGKDNPAQSWPYIQPGPLDAWAGSKSHTNSILFDLTAVPAGGCMLQIYYIDTHAAAPPTLRATIGSYVQETDLKPGASDASLTDPKAGKAQSLMLYIPANYLHTGTNTIQLTSTAGSWMIYDSIVLWGCTTQPALIQGAIVSPTILFKNRPDGLKQILNADFSLLMGQSNINAEITSDAGWSVQQNFGDIHFGNPTLELEIPPVSSAQTVHVTLTASGSSTQVNATATPQKQWKIYLLPSAHFDNGYTAPQDQCLALHRQNTDRAIDWCGRYPDFVWNLESSITAEDYLANGSRKSDFISLAQQGRLGIQGFYTSMLTGLCSGEEQSLMLDYYDMLRHNYGIQAECAMQTDVPSMVGTMPMVLAGHGIKYISHAMNDPRAYKSDRVLYYWESPDGSRVLAWNAYLYARSEGIHGSGDTYLFSRVKNGVIWAVDDYSRRSNYPYDAILLHGAYWDNAPNREAVASIPAQWNSTYAYPKLIESRGSEFFKYIEANYAGVVPVVKGDGGVYWEDGAASSAFETGECRTAKETLQAAQKIMALCPPADQTALASKFADAWKNILLFDEHGWGAAQSISDPNSPATIEQWAVKKGYADNAVQLANELLASSMDSITSGLGSAEDSIVVFNPSSWARYGLVECKLPSGQNVSLYADYVPPLGYRIFPASKARSTDPAGSNESTLENAYYTVTFDSTTGAVRSIYDKQLHRELVDTTSAFKLNEYLYIDHGTYGFARETGNIDTNLQVLHCSSPVFSKAVLPGKQVMKVTATAPMANSFSSQVTLYDNEKKIEFSSSLDKKLTYNKEGGYFAFPFALSNPNFRLEIPNGVIRPDVDQITAACKDWFDVQHFVTASDSSTAIIWSALDSPLITLQDIHRGQDQDSLTFTNGSIFAYAFNNYWHTNYRAGQSGPMTFRFAITSTRSIDDVDAKRFGESSQSPLVAKWIPRRSGSNPAIKSYIKVSAGNVIIQAVKPARFASGTIVQMREIAGRTSNASIYVNGISFNKAYLCNLAEDKLENLPVKNGVISFPCRLHGLTTVLLAQE